MCMLLAVTVNITYYSPAFCYVLYSYSPLCKCPHLPQANSQTFPSDSRFHRGKRTQGFIGGRGTGFPLHIRLNVIILVIA